MSVFARKPQAIERPAIWSGALVFTVGGLFAAFGAAACCALPLLLTTIGLSAASLSGVAGIAAPHRSALLFVAGVSLFGGAVQLWRQQRAAVVCSANGTCRRPAVRAFTLVGLLVGFGLLCAGLVYE